MAKTIHVHVGCAVLLCLVCLFDLKLACFFLSSLIKNIYIYMCIIYIRERSAIFSYMYMYEAKVISMCMHVLMRDEKEERKEQACASLPHSLFAA